MAVSPIGLQHIRNVIHRRGLAYFVYLVTGWALPAIPDEYVWGPPALASIRRMFRRLAARMTPHAVAELDSGAPREMEMDRLHRAGITGFRHVLQGHPARLRRHARRGIAFAAARNADRCAFNRRFGASLLTEASARDLLSRAAARVTNGYKDYSPIDFGGGLTLGRILTTDSGTGRWQFFNRTIVAPLVRGARVLDLGCNN